MDPPNLKFQNQTEPNELLIVHTNIPQIKPQNPKFQLLNSSVCTTYYVVVLVVCGCSPKCRGCTTDKRTDVWSRPSCNYTQISSPKKPWFFRLRKYFPNLFCLLFTFILCNVSVQTLIYFKKFFELIFCP